MPEHDPKMTDEAAAERAELRRLIDRLMAEPAREMPPVIVVGDDSVSAIYPPKAGG